MLELGEGLLIGFRSGEYFVLADIDADHSDC
jgi:hypothetical protein